MAVGPTASTVTYGRLYTYINLCLLFLPSSSHCARFVCQWRLLCNLLVRRSIKQTWRHSARSSLKINYHSFRYAPKQRDPLIGLILISFLHIRLISRMLVHHHHTHDGLHRIDGLLVIDSEGTDPDGAAVTRAYPGEVKMCKNGSSNKSSHLELECHKNYTVLLLAHILSSRVNSKRVNQRAPVAVNYSSHVCSRHEHWLIIDCSEFPRWLLTVW